VLRIILKKENGCGCQISLLKNLRPGRYTVFIRTGSLDGIDKTYDYIWEICFLSTKEKLDSWKGFDLYDQRF
jgi:AraC family transcriptional regulator